MTVIGITGPSGAGKTTALEVLDRMGFEIVDCDALYYRLLRTEEPLRRSLTDAFGPVFLPDGSLDRRALARRVFADGRELARLNAIVFPAVSAAVAQIIRDCRKKGVAIDAVNLVESGMGELCDATVAVTAAPAVRLKRIMARDGLTREQALARIEAQKQPEWYRERCTALLENQEEDRAAYKAFVTAFFQDLLKNLNHKGDEKNGREGMEEKGADGQEKRL